MASLASISASSDPAWEFFGSSDMLEAASLVAAARREAIAKGRVAEARDISVMMVDLQRELDSLSFKAAEIFDEKAREKLEQTRLRPQTNRGGKHLEDCIASKPWGGFGGVKVGLVEELDQAERDGGVYWRTQEVGSVEVGNIMTGRRLVGRFDDDRPRSEFSRDNLGPGVMAPSGDFHWGGTNYGKGVIRSEIEGRHYLAEGAERAWEHYVAEISRLSHNYATRLGAIVSRHR